MTDVIENSKQEITINDKTVVADVLITAEFDREDKKHFRWL